MGLRVPKLREGTYFSESMPTCWLRVDVSAAVAVHEMYACGGVHQKGGEGRLRHAKLGEKDAPTWRRDQIGASPFLLYLIT